MRILRGLVTVGALACLTVAPAYAGPNGGQHGRPVVAAQAHAHPTAQKVAAAKPTAHASPTVAQRIAAHPQLASRLQPLVPPGMTLDTAAAGFKNQGQFIAALHVSHNLGIPFAQLKAEMTGADRDSLGQAIQHLRPNVNAKGAAHLAENEANDDLKAMKVTVRRDTGRDRDRDDR